MVFSSMLYSTCLAYLDDIFIFGRTFEEHLDRLDYALKRLENANLKLKPSKCAFGKKSVAFLRNIISKHETSIDLEKVKRHQEWARPRNEKSTWILAMYRTTGSTYEGSLTGFAHIVDPLNKLLQKNHSFQ